MVRPFQRALFCAARVPGQPGILLLASGPSIFSFCAETGKCLAEWNSGTGESQEDVPVEANDQSSSETPPTKKRKLLHLDNIASDASSAEIVTENGTNKRHRSKKKLTTLPLITHLRASKDGRYVVLTTGDDKGLRVLEMSALGTFKKLSERFLIKKASSVFLMTDQQTILCADKFGDVFAFPLHPTQIHHDDMEGPDPSEPPLEESRDTFFKPSASELTVHTKRNRKALHDQLMQRTQNSPGNKKSHAQYRPILGHVSLLTDVIHVALDSGMGRRSYILTSDRDEHIRVSRGPPQAHVIEGYCLEHKQFVSKLCVPELTPKLLLSGGGDDCILLWHWLSGKCIGEVPLRNFVESSMGELGPIAVSGLWALTVNERESAIIVSLEGLPGLLTFCVDEDGKVSNTRAIELPSNVLDVAPIPDQGTILWTVDNVHKPRSTKECREIYHETRIGMHRWDACRQEWYQLPLKDSPLLAIEEWTSDPSNEEMFSVEDTTRYRELYYGIEHLRKHPAEDIE